MLSNVKKALSQHAEPEALAQAFLRDYYEGKTITYPINPFQMLTDMDVPFVFRSFSKNYEGFYFPPQDENDIPFVAINLKRPIARQRFTAAHEICHFLKDGDCKNNVVCAKNSKLEIERYADHFASELLMPTGALSRIVEQYKAGKYVDFENALKISFYFGVSFEACVYRLAYSLKVIDGDVTSQKLKKRMSAFAPQSRKKELNLQCETHLYEGLFDAIKPWLLTAPSLHTQYKFENEYVYNDNRLENIEIDRDVAAEIVADLRLHQQESEFCTSKYKEIVEVAGHAVMYKKVFEQAKKDRLSIFDILLLNISLYSCTPFPEYGGKFRNSNTLVLGAKFETVNYERITSEVAALAGEVQYLDEHKEDVRLSEWIERAVKLHHKLTIIHPFSDGNGRTTRAFLNLMLIRNDIPPVYFKVENKEEYLLALGVADKTDNYSPLYEAVFKAILRSHAELTEFPMLLSPEK